MQARVWLALALAPLAVRAQVSFDNGAFQVHSFLSEGFIKTNENNFLTMDTSGAGSAVMAEAGLNLSVRLRDNLRISAQGYSHYVGEMGRGQVMLDFALVDYRWKDWLGIRAGKVKTPLGLFNDTQDMTFLYTWALLPQSVYPMDLRSMTIAHQGGDIYGDIKAGKGSLSYQAYAGTIPDDPRGGYTYSLIQNQGVKMNGGINGRAEGADLRWSTPVNGLMIGASVVYNERDFKGWLRGIPLSYQTSMDKVIAGYGEYAKGPFRLDAEYRSTVRHGNLGGLPFPVTNNTNEVGWFVAGSYRLSNRVSVGSYYGAYTFAQVQHPQISANFSGPGANFIHDPAVSTRFALTKFWDFKVEGHFMNGFGGVSAHGFYAGTNPQGLKPQTLMLVLRTGWFF